LFFVGAQDLSKLSATSLDEWHRHFWEALNRELPATNGLPVLLLKPRNNIARQAGLVANSLGVLFEKLHEPEKAWNAYAQARRLDSENFCALLNQVFLSSSGDIHPESHDELQFELDQAVRQRHSIPDAYVLINTNGDICHPERYNDMRMRWDPASPENQANLAFQELSDFGMEHALDIRGLLWAALNIRPSTFTNREQACKSRLMANPADGRALTELSLLAVCQGQTDDAQHWVDLAFHAGVANSNLCLPKAAIRLASCRPDLAEPELTAALNDRQAGDLTLWTCLGAALFQEHNIKDIEHRVLPGMRAVCPSEEDWRIQTIQAYLALNQKGSDAFSKARTSFLCALRLHPNMPTVRNALLWIDVVRANMLNIEQDASDTLLYAPSDAFATFLLAKALISQQTDLPRAESLLKTSLTTRCTSIALAWLADAQRQQNRLSEAEQTARDALKINDHACVPWEKLSYVLMDQNRDEEAFAAIQHALRYANSSPSALLQKAVLLARMERLNEAEEIAAREHTDWQNLPENLMNLRRDLEAKIDAARPRKKINYGL